MLPPCCPSACFGVDPLPYVVTSLQTRHSSLSFYVFILPVASCQSEAALEIGSFYLILRFLNKVARHKVFNLFDAYLAIHSTSSIYSAIEKSAFSLALLHLNESGESNGSRITLDDIDSATNNLAALTATQRGMRASKSIADLISAPSTHRHHSHSTEHAGAIDAAPKRIRHCRTTPYGLTGQEKLP